MMRYSLFDYGAMIADRVRMAAYREALRRTVTPESVVLDVGTGSGVCALLACQSGARRVFAVEPDDVIQVARAIARANGYAERIQFVQGLSTEVCLPEKADIVVSDLRGVLPLFRHHLPSIVDVRQRLLAPGGRLIPQRDTLWAAVVDAPDAYRDHLSPWDQHPFGLDMRAARRLAVNRWRKVRLQPEQLLVEPSCWASLDYLSLESPQISGEVSWNIERQGTGYGLGVWFDTVLVEGVGFSNAPGTPELIYGNAFFPWESPVALAPGDSVTVSLRADLVGEDYVWGWNTSVYGQGHPSQIKACFRQSTFLGRPLSPEQLRKRVADYVPSLAGEGQVNRFILDRMDGNHSLRTIADQLWAAFPDRFESLELALEKVRQLSEKYSR